MKPGNLWDTGKKVFSQLGMHNGVNYNPKWKQGDQKLVVWGHGPVIEYSHCQHIKDLDNYQGSQMTTFLVDEGTQLEWEMISYLFSRMRSDSKYKSRMVISCNPSYDHMLRKMVDFYVDDEGFPIEDKLGIERYFYVINDVPVFGDTSEELIERYPLMAEGLDGDIIPPMSFSFIASNVYQNPILLKNNPRYLSALKGLGELERKVLLDGCWNVKPESASYFKREWLQKWDKIPLGSKFRGWDKANTPVSKDSANKYPDFTACTGMVKTAEGDIVIIGDHHEDNKDKDDGVYGRFRELPGRRNQIMLRQAQWDGPDCTVVLAQDPNGKFEFEESVKFFNSHGFIVKKDPAIVSSSKLTKYSAFSSACENGTVGIVESSFHPDTLEDFYKCHERFTGLRSSRTYKDDIPDSTASTFAVASQSQHIPIVCRNQIQSDTISRNIIEKRNQ